jgi:putative intracellular protease/amidase
VEEILALCRAVSRPVNVLARPDLSLRQLVCAGARRIRVGGALTWVAAAAAFHQAGKITAIVCHATCILLKATLPNGDLLVKDKTWTGFANSEEDYADDFVGQRIQPFRIEDAARAIPDTNFIVQGRFRPHAVRHGLLITGQQQYSGAAAARLVIEALAQ